MNPAAPALQKVWDWRAAGNFIGGGTGTGLLLITVLAVLMGTPALAPTLTGLAFVAAGLSCVWLEIGRPLRAVNVFFHPHTSWMTREAIVALPLMLFGLLAAWLGWAGLVVLAAATGMVFLYCQGRILQAAKGIPVWRSPRIVPLVIATGLTEGTGIFLALMPLLAPSAVVTAGVPTLTVLAVLLAVRYGVWRWYRRGLVGNAPQAALAVLGRSEPTVALIGAAAPLALALAALALPEQRFVLGAVAGVFAAMGGWFIKFVIVTRAAYNQGFAIAHSPARGGGLPGPGTKPGW